MMPVTIVEGENNMEQIEERLSCLFSNGHLARTSFANCNQCKVNMSTARQSLLPSYDTK